MAALDHFDATIRSMASKHRPIDREGKGHCVKPEYMSGGE